MTRPLSPATLARLRRRFDLIPDVMKAEARRVIDDTAENMVKEMRRAIDDDTGALSASVRAEDVGVEHAVRVRVKAGGPLTTVAVRAGGKGNSPSYDYARAIEYGTPKAPPEPFFRPTRDRHVKRLRFRLRAAIKKALASMGSQNPG